MEMSNFTPTNAQLDSETHLLVVEDGQSAGEALKEMLESDGHDVSLVTSGKAAVKKVFNKGDNIDTILMDIKMPGEIDGIEAVCEIQKASYGRIPTIFVTAFADDKVYKQRVREAGLRNIGWIDKPILGGNKEKLFKLIGNNMRKKEMRVKIYSQFKKEISAIKIQNILEELNLQFGIDLLIDVVKDINAFYPSAKIDTDEIFPYLNFIAYQNMKEELEEKNPGQFVAFLDGVKVGHSPIRDDLIREFYVKHQRTDIFVTRIVGEPRVIKLRHPRRVYSVKAKTGGKK